MPTHIKNVINGFLKNKSKELDVKQHIEKIIDSNLDIKLKKYIRLQKIYKNKLIFSSDAASASYDFNLKQKRLLSEIKKEFPAIEEIKIKNE